MIATSRLVSCGLLLLGAVAFTSCDNDPGIQQVGTGGNGGSGTGAGGSGAGGSGAGGSGMGGSGAGGRAPMPPGAGGGGGTSGAGGGTGGAGMVGGGDKCSATSAMAKPVPVDIYVLLDRSRSMNQYANGSGGLDPKPDPMPGTPATMVSKWFATKDALKKFVESPSAAGISVGLGYFPWGNDEDQICDNRTYATPVVPLAELPGGAMAFLGNLATAQTNGGTPTLPALTGTIAFARQREMMTGRRLAIALATDGQPNDCNSSVNSVSNAAAMGAMQGILTFVIGVGPSLQNLNRIAMAGGTNQAYLVQNATADELAAAFKSVQAQATKLACSFMIPPPPMGMTLDPMKVNVKFTGGMSFDIPAVADRSACGAQGGWYYDNPMKPTVVNLCEATCAKVNSSGEGQLELLFGCASEVIK